MVLKSRDPSRKNVDIGLVNTTQKLHIWHETSREENRSVKIDEHSFYQVFLLSSKSIYQVFLI